MFLEKILFCFFVFTTILFVGFSTAASQPTKFPNIGFIALGYNIYYGNPNAIGKFDPGFRILEGGQIFNLTYSDHRQTTDGRWLLPNKIIAQPVSTCTSSASSTTLFGSKSYANYLDQSVSTHGGAFGARFSASTDYKSLSETTTKNGYVYTSSQAECVVYQAGINTFNNLPALDPTFEKAVSSLPDTFSSSNQHQFFSFFDTFGTHYLSGMSFGSRYGYLYTHSESEWQHLSATSLNVNTAASYAAEFNVGMKTSTNKTKAEAQAFMKSTTQTQSYSLGQSPPTDGSATTWEQNSLNSNNIEPLSYNASSIPDLLTATNSTKADVVATALQAYCKYLQTNGKLVSCNTPTNPTPPKNIPLYATFSSQTWITNAVPNSGYTFFGKITDDPYPDIVACSGGICYVNANLHGTGFIELQWSVANAWGGAGYTFSGDFNGDGFLDIASFSGGNGYMKLNNGGTAFVSSTWSLNTPWGGGGSNLKNTGYTQVLDVNFDGFDDLINAIGDNLYVTLSTGSGWETTFTLPIGGSNGGSWGASEFTSWAQSWSASQKGLGETTRVPINIDGSGLVQIASAYGGDVFIKKIDMGSHPKATGYTLIENMAWSQWYWTGVIDWNGDGLTDVVTANGGNLYVAISDGPTLKTEILAASPDWGGYFIVGDFNGDGMPDLASPYGASIYIHFNDKGSSIQTQQASVAGTWGSYPWTFVADFDQNGKDDIASWSGGSIFVKLSQ